MALATTLEATFLSCPSDSRRCYIRQPQQAWLACDDGIIAPRVPVPIVAGCEALINAPGIIDLSIGLAAPYRLQGAFEGAYASYDAAMAEAKREAWRLESFKLWASFYAVGPSIRPAKGYTAVTGGRNPQHANSLRDIASQ